MNWVASLISASLLASATAFPANAITTYDIIGTILGGSFDGEEGIGSISFEELLLDGFGDGELGPPGGTVAIPDPSFALEFTIFGQTFTASDDIDFPDYPILDVFDYAPAYIDYVVEEAALFPYNPTDISELGVFGFFFGDLIIESGEIYVDVFVEELAPVPVPAGFPLLLAALGGLGIAAGRRKAA